MLRIKRKRLAEGDALAEKHENTAKGEGTKER
jgi:hypothetical protein